MIKIEAICLEDEAFYVLVDKVVEYIKKEHGVSGPKWIREPEAMELLGVTSKATLQRYRDEDRIRFSQKDKKVIMYDRDSILAYLDKHANKKPE